ncbi:MAG: adenylate/guanylate cyclase domain-containing protein [Armatimonadota bacterium]|nr:adenylate/guanylate cyclase domain-containing protein [Armatimonadota bacterium]
MCEQPAAELERCRARVAELERQQWALERRVFQLETLAAFAHEAASCRDVRSAARTLLNVLSGTFGAVSGAVLLVEHEDETWSVPAVRGFTGELPPLSTEDSQALLRWLQANPAPQSPPDLTGSGLQSFVAALGSITAAAPIFRQHEPEGLILLGETLRGELLDADDLEVCAVVARAAANLFGDIQSTERYLRQQQERFRIRGVFEQYCAPDVVDRLLDQQGGLKIGVDQKSVTVLMADIRGSTQMLHRLPLRRAAELLNDYLSAMTDVVFTHRGTMDKFMGDAVMAVFGDPVAADDDTWRAVRCAREMLSRFENLAAQYAGTGLSLGLGIGVTTGLALCGTFGSSRRFTYTVMGPPVHLASRLCELAEGGQIFIDRATYSQIQGRIAVEPLSPMWLKGFEGPVPAFRLL